jgi:hypothetical protein
MITFLESQMRQTWKWDIKMLKKLSAKTGLKVSQLYKWNWDRI